MNLLLNEDGTCRCDIIHHTKQTEISLPSTERLLLDGRWKKNEGVDIEFTIKSWVKTWPANTPGAGATDRVKEMVHDAAPLKMTLFLKNNELSCAWFTLGNIKTMGAGDTSVIQLMVPKFQKK
jgi:hypothetical protein